MIYRQNYVPSTVDFGNPYLETAYNGKNTCSYKVDHRIIGDPAVGCAKTYVYAFECCHQRECYSQLPAEASGKTLTIGCGSKRIEIETATYYTHKQAGNAGTTLRYESLVTVFPFQCHLSPNPHCH